MTLTNEDVRQHLHYICNNLPEYSKRDVLKSIQCLVNHANDVGGTKGTAFGLFALSKDHFKVVRNNETIASTDADHVNSMSSPLLS